MISKTTILNISPPKFAVTPQSVMENPNITFKAKGLWAYLQTQDLANGIEVSEMVKLTKDGIDGIISGIQELVDNGFLITVQTGDNTSYILADEPYKIKPITQAPQPKPKKHKPKDDIDNYPDELRNKYKAFMNWINSNAPRVNRMKKPFTIKEYSEIIEGNFDRNEVAEVLKQMDNWAKLHNNVSSYRTLCNWINRKREKGIPPTENDYSKWDKYK